MIRPTQVELISMIGLHCIKNCLEKANLSINKRLICYTTGLLAAQSLVFYSIYLFSQVSEHRQYIVQESLNCAVMGFITNVFHLYKIEVPEPFFPFSSQCLCIS